MRIFDECQANTTSLKSNKLIKWRTSLALSEHSIGDDDVLTSECQISQLNYIFVQKRRKKENDSMYL